MLWFNIRTQTQSSSWRQKNRKLKNLWKISNNLMLVCQKKIKNSNLIMLVNLLI